MKQSYRMLTTKKLRKLLCPLHARWWTPLICLRALAGVHGGTEDALNALARYEVFPTSGKEAHADENHRLFLPGNKSFPPKRLAF